MAVPSKLKPQTPQNDSKFLVFMEQLDDLLLRFPTCGAVVSKKRNVHSGSLLRRSFVPTCNMISLGSVRTVGMA